MSLLKRTVYSNLLVAGVAVLSLTALLLAGYRAEFQNQQTARASMLARFVAAQSEVPALLEDRGAIEKIAAQAAATDEVLFVRIEFRGGHKDVFARGTSDGEKQRQAWNVLGKGWVEAAADIRPVRSGLLDWDDGVPNRPENLGHVELRISSLREESLFWDTAQLAAFIAGLLLILVVAIQYVRMRNLFRPIGELIAFTRRVGAGGLSERSRVDQADEIAEVAVAFNQMLDRLSGTTVSRDYVDNIIHSMAECLIVVGSDGVIRTVNEAASLLLNYEESELVGAHGSVVMGDDWKMSNLATAATERFWKTRDGRLIPVLFSSAALRKSISGEEGMVWLAQDITDRKKVQGELIAARERYALAVAGANDGIWDWNVLTDEVYFSPRWKAMLGYDDGEMASRISTWLDLLHPDDRPRVEREMEAHRIGASAMFESEHRMRHCDGSYRWMLNRGLAVRSDDGTATRIAGSQTDITQNKVSDSLTGLPNRVYFTERLTNCFERRKREPAYQFAVLFLDLDRFKMINDSLGHLAGDQLLIGIAQRLQTGVRSALVACEHTVARLSGDEFAVLLENIQAMPATNAGSVVGEQLLKELSSPFVLEGREIFTSLSIGVAPDNGEYAGPSEILRDADTAMYRAKAGGKSRCEIFDAEMRAQVVSRLELDTDLRKAVERNEFVVYYQPKYSIPDERLTGFEALVRWIHPTRGLVAPNNFIPLAEETGLILQIGSLVLREACKQMKTWQARYPVLADAVISVNISPRQFLVPNLVGHIKEILQEAELAPRSLALEITETVLMDHTDRALETLSQLKSLGVGLMIDDFGTGYSSLNYLHRYPFDTVKIDRSFVANVETEEGAAIVRAIISLADNLGMNVVSEGVETSHQMTILTRLGSHDGQGYYFSKPVPASVAEVIVATPRHSKAEVSLTALNDALAKPSQLIQA